VKFNKTDKRVAAFVLILIAAAFLVAGYVEMDAIVRSENAPAAPMILVDDMKPGQVQAIDKRFQEIESVFAYDRGRI
jgi:hypothetical protein